MFDKFVEQAQSSVKPMNEVISLNAEALEKFAEKQTSLFTGMMNDGLAYAKDLASQKDLAGVYETQKTFAEGVQEKLVSSAKDSYSLMTETSEKVSEIFKGAFSEVKKPEAAPQPQNSVVETPAKVVEAEVVN